MKCLVTGGAGFIGSHLVDRLLEKGHKVTVIDNFLTGKKENLTQHSGNKALKIITGDIIAKLDNYFNKGKFDVVFHLAACPRVQLSIERPETTHDTGIDGTFNLLQVCKRFGVKKFIFSSSCSVYGDQEKLPFTEDMRPNPLSPYALSKLVGEYYCHLFYSLYGLETINLRYFNVFGPRQSSKGGYASLIPSFFERLMKNENPTIYGDGKHTRDFVFVSDVVEANLLAMACKHKTCFGQVFNIGLGKSYSVNQTSEIITGLIGCKLKPSHGPAVIEPKNTVADITKSKLVLGWKPKIKFEEGLKLTYRELLA